MPRTIALAALLVLAGTAVATTATDNSDCRSPPQEGRVLDQHQVSHPQNGDYLYVPQGQEDSHKFGWWTEKNGLAGLQTTHCELVTGEFMYPADKFVGILP